MKTLYQTKFLSLYEVDNNGNPYYVASRQQDYDPNVKIADAVTLFVLSPDGEQLLMVKENRPAVGGFVYSTPAGLIDGDERPETSALRELTEETGYKNARVLNVLPATYSSVGMTNEAVHPVILKLNDLENDGQRLEDTERIEYFWIDKEQAKLLAMTSERLTARAQLMLLLFATDQLEALHD